MDDFELIRGILSGDKRSWDKFVNTYSNLIYHTIIRCFHKNGRPIAPEAIADLYQDVFVKLLKNNYKALRAFQSRNRCKLSTYLTKIVENMVIDFLRRPKPDDFSNDNNIRIDYRSGEFLKELSDESAKELIKNLDAKTIIERFIKKLNEKEKKVFCMMLDKTKSRDAARELGITAENYGMRENRLEDKLRRFIEKERNF
ncbi:MAG: RNA polymerase sigma factor [Candidatus Omnitrophota bacterium]